MFFIVLTFFAALFIEGLGSLVSVIGISALFGANPIIIALAISLDVGKIVVVSLLYTYWHELSRLMKAYALIAATVTMVITSAGAAGYLSAAFQTAIIGTKEGELKVNVLKEQQAKYQERKKQIDDQVANLPERTTVNQRLRLMNGFKAEQKALDDKITAIDKELPDAQIKQIGVEAKAGPILYIARAFNISVEEAVKWVIALIIFVFDPLAIFLIIAGNFLWARRKATRPAEAVHQHSFIPPEPMPPAPVPPSEQAAEPIAPPELFANLKPQEEIITSPPLGKEFPNEETPVPEVKPSKPTYAPTGLLKPINVDLDTHRTTDSVFESHPISFEDGPKSIPLDKEVPVNEEITRSTLGIVDADSATIVDAGRVEGFRRARAMVVPPKK